MTEPSPRGRRCKLTHRRRTDGPSSPLKKSLGTEPARIALALGCNDPLHNGADASRPAPR